MVVVLHSVNFSYIVVFICHDNYVSRGGLVYSQIENTWNLKTFPFPAFAFVVGVEQIVVVVVIIVVVIIIVVVTDVV